MSRPNLTPEQKAARRKARNAHTFSNAAYKHYDPSEGLGSEEEWISLADAILKGKGALHFQGKETQVQRDLKVLFLTVLPETAELLKRGFRQALMKLHPDHGGTHEGCLAAMEAFKRLSNNY